MQARTHRSQSWAETQFTKAEAQRETLEGYADQTRTRHQYEIVIASYRRVVLEAPTSSKADASAFHIAELTAEMGRHFKDDMALYSAVREYKFLRREYPGSHHRVEALLAIAEIYKNDLSDDSDARPAYEELLRRYPRNELAKQARAELSTLSSAAPDGSEQAASDEGEARPSLARANKARTAASSQTAKSASGGNDSSEGADTDRNPSDDSDSDKPVRVSDVQYWSSPDYTRVTVDLQQDVRFESQRIDDPNRIFFDLKNAKLAAHLLGRSLNVDDGLVKRIRVAQYKPNLARVVVETTTHANYNASLVLNPPRLVIDIHSDDTHSAEPTTVADSKPTLAAPTVISSRSGATKSGARQIRHSNSETVNVDSSDFEPNSLPPGVPASPKRVVVQADDDSDSNNDPKADSDGAATISKSTKSAVQARSRKSALGAAKSLREAEPTSTGDRSLIRTLGLRIGKIVIDPGHGGHDTGTIGPNGLYEKDLVLDVSKRLGKLLEARLGAEVVFTRRDDTFIPLETRTSIANQEEADLFVSVHANSSRDPDARGVETYYLNFTSSPEALEVAARENAASDKSIHELQDLVKKIALKEKIEESREFASDVQESLHHGLALKNSSERDRGVKKAPFVVLIGANMPSILAEISFLSNPGDEKHLKTPEYRQRIAESLYRGIARYVNGLGGVKMATKIEKASAD